jgi:uncharacterized caspase-like protein
MKKSEPTIYGVFIGIDRYASSAINWLSCAGRDAIALHALFADNLPGEFTLLVDKNATRSAIQSEVDELSKCGEDDIVIFAFSGHGSETHELICYDTDTADLGKTAIHLNELAEWFSKIPARQLVCILDCCFLGGMGAKALQVYAKPREVSSGDKLLQQLSGNGRIILTASLAVERAWENQKLGLTRDNQYVMGRI